MLLHAAFMGHLTHAMSCGPQRGTTAYRSVLVVHRGELRGETHPAPANLTSAPGGITLGREQAELDADFKTLLGKTMLCISQLSNRQHANTRG